MFKNTKIRVDVCQCLCMLAQDITVIVLYIICIYHVACHVITQAMIIRLLHNNKNTIFSISNILQTSALRFHQEQVVYV